MDIIKTPLEGLLILKPNVFKDNRGYFFESWSELDFTNIGLDLKFVQDNQSLSNMNVLRGFHYQNPPFDQGKLVRVIKGKVLDVVVDLRRHSLTYGQHFAVELSDLNKLVFWIPSGFAHAFLSLEDGTIFSYKCTAFYNKAAEGSLLWNDVDLKINWGIDNPLVSEKDLKASNFKNFKSKF